MKKKVMIIIIVMLMLMLSSVFAKSFTDVSSDHWAYESINELMNKGILNGYPDGTFLPNKPVTRAEFSKILVLSLNLKEPSNIVFEDVGKEFWGYDYINIASKYLEGYGGSDKMYYMPNAVAIREDITVAMVFAANLENKDYNLNTINRFKDKDEISENLRKYVAIAVEYGLLQGNADGTFNPKGNLTRAQVSKVMLNALNLNIQVDEKILYGDVNDDGRVNNNDLTKLTNYMKNNSVKINRQSSDVNLDGKINNIDYYMIKLANKNKIDLPHNCGKKYELVYDEKNDSDHYINIKCDCRDLLDYTSLYEEHNFKGNKCQECGFVKEEEEQQTVITKFVLDELTGTVNLGANYKDYQFSYSNTKDKLGKIYYPSNSKLVYNEYNANNTTATTKSTFAGKYLYIMAKGITNEYIMIEIPDLFAGVVYTAEQGIVNLGDNWKNYKYTYSDIPNKLEGAYTPSQRNLIYNFEKANKSGSSTRDVFKGLYLYIMKKSNYDCYKIIDVSNIPNNISVMPKFVFDKATGTVDLGVNWNKYEFSYSNKANRLKGIYTPTQRVLTYNEYKADTAMQKTKAYFKDDYLFIMPKGTVDYYKIVEIPDPFEDIVYTPSKGTVDLGNDYKKYKFTYSDSKEHYVWSYTPTQRTLSYEFNTDDSESKFDGLSLFIELKDNRDCYKYIDISDIPNNMDVLPKFKYDIDTGTVDLGENWDKYKFAHSDTKGVFEYGIYKPTQRILTYNEYEVDNSNLGNNPRDVFKGKYLYIMPIDSDNNCAEINIKDPFQNVKFNPDSHVLDLGNDWNKYLYACEGYGGFATFYKPSKSLLTLAKTVQNYLGDGETISNSNIKVKLKENEDCYKIIDIDSYKNLLPDFEFDSDAGIISLGSKYKKYQFSYSDRKYTLGKIYTPAGEDLILNIRDEDTSKTKSTFKGKYVYIMEAGNPNNYKMVETFNIFKDITLNTSSYSINLGGNYNNFEFSFSNDNSNFSEPHRATKREIVKNSNITEENASYSYNGRYVKISSYYCDDCFFIIDTLDI